MEHFCDSIQGYFNCAELYRRMVAEAKDGAVFVELGVWRGKSAAFLGVEIINSGKKIELCLVDHFKGSPELMNQPEIINGTLLEETTARLEPIKDVIKIYPYPSVEAAKMFADESIDFIYIDGAHLYDDVKSDILAWSPKVKTGGIISGDDYAIREHPDVKVVVDELFPTATKEGVYWWIRKDAGVAQW